MDENVLEVLGDATREAGLIQKRLRDLPASASRHGDMQVIRGAALRLIDKVTVLITYEEGDTPAELPPAVEPESEPAAAPAKRRQFTRKNKRPPTAEPAAGELQANGRLPGGNQQTLLRLIQKRAYSSGELIERTGLSAGTVYGALNVMRSKGLIETREDEADGQRKNFLREMQA
jgi:DNA-binding transcriptional ArsR family regulator